MNTLPDFIDILTPIRERQSYVAGMAEKLAGIVTDLINKHEPLLRAECDGVEIKVTERGGSLAFSFAIEPEQAGPIAAELNEESEHDGK